MIRAAPFVLLAAVIGCTLHHVHRVELVVVTREPTVTPEPSPTPTAAPPRIVIAPTPEPSPTSTTPTPTPVSVLDAIEEKVERLREAVEQ